jgi:hypothetical protein
VLKEEEHNMRAFDCFHARSNTTTTLENETYLKKYKQQEMINWRKIRSAFYCLWKQEMKSVGKLTFVVKHFSAVIFKFILFRSLFFSLFFIVIIIMNINISIIVLFSKMLYIRE